MNTALNYCTCNHCGKPFLPKAADRTSYCSRDCFFDKLAIEREYKTKKKINIKTVNNCINLLTKALKHIDCNQAKIKTRVCVVCSKEFKQTRIMGVPDVVCGDVCKSYKLKNTKAEYKKTKNYKLLRYNEKVKRRLSSNSEYERVDFESIMESQHYQCALCGYDAPKHLRGTNEFNAPEIDHIIPLSKGGSHTTENCQMLCRKCNLKKSDSLPNPLGGKQ